MKLKLEIVPLSHLDIEEIRSWWPNASLSHVEEPSDAWCDYILDNDSVYGWAITTSSRLVGYIQEDRESLEESSLAIVVHPDFHRSGIATTALNLLMNVETHPWKSQRKYCVYISYENTASLRLFEKLGFSRTLGTIDKCGLIKLSKIVA